ncbi:hypothetical protein GGQ88_001925 [Novosphingobium hassiacum]|uniref:Uncharacterized protein n=1 Tax=Novosphingobium hassiacum TaxID=173676 RepID=A0A7W6EVX8_9SPHN|nr:hypothetical protein [Novosphingobium hassiacum]MBB3860656.1 hypothetical protein [Novosphingobium hassiacum]
MNNVDADVIVVLLEVCEPGSPVAGDLGIARHLRQGDLGQFIYRKGQNIGMIQTLRIGRTGDEGFASLEDAKRHFIASEADPRRVVEQVKQYQVVQYLAV